MDNPAPVFEFEDVFDDDYIRFMEAVQTPEVNEKQACAIVSLLSLPLGARVLDVPCGYGRISNQLARLGMKVTGVDFTPMFLHRAREHASALGVDVDFREGDIRKLSGLRDFDAVVNWFTSFGYFDDDKNRATLRGLHDTLRPGGKLLIEHMNFAMRIKTPHSAIVQSLGDDIMIDRPVLDLLASRTVSERIIVRGGRVRRANFMVRVFMPSELADWLRAAGFEDIRFCDHDGAPFTVDSRRMVAIATRPA